MRLFIPVKVILLYITTTSTFSSAQKGTIINNNKLETKSISECERCKLVSFNYWLEKTSRGKHEGVDAAWEEAKLKSYARSEMRLVEIQESLCSELQKHQDDCYSLLEDAEHILEKWWFHKDRNSLDLYSWLCIENLRFCCPPNHYGTLCIPCLRDKNNMICGGNGKCNGDGTRKGDGRCICKKGFTGTGCDECADNFYNSTDECKPCHKACENCHDEGVDSCVKCASGWSMESGICIDNNECLDMSICKSSEYCINIDGSYTCKPCDKSCKTCVGPGSFNCTFCYPNHVLFFGICINVELQTVILDNLPINFILYVCFFILCFICSQVTSLPSYTILNFALLVYYIENSLDDYFYNINNFFRKLWS